MTTMEFAALAALILVLLLFAWLARRSRPGQPVPPSADAGYPRPFPVQDMLARRDEILRTCGYSYAEVRRLTRDFPLGASEPTQRQSKEPTPDAPSAEASQVATAPGDAG